MTNFNVPKKIEVSENNQAIFDGLESKVGFVPNLYAVMAHSDSALENYLQLQGGKTSLTNKEKEVVNLIVSQINGCNYCQSAHTAIGKMNGFTESQIIDLRKGAAPWDGKLDALVKLAKGIVETKGNITDHRLDAFYEASYTKGSLVDVILLIAEKTMMNYLHNLTKVDIDFPLALDLELELADV